jgi:TonB-linked SusC/RagA family outer membrane protein
MPRVLATLWRSVVNVAMEAAAIMMQEIVVTGYGTQQRRDVTGAVASVDAEDLTPIATSSVEQMLQGRVAGVQITPKSGGPGDSVIVRIRGVGTLNNASPLYVVDGMLLDDIAFVSPSDIASLEVLKDASATAIYGSRGANGVIIVTTKRGAVDRPTQFTIRSYAGAQSTLKKIDLVNGRDYAMLTNERADNVGQARPFPNPDTVSVNTDWQDQIFETAPIRNYGVSASGGADRIAYFFSGDLFRQAGVVPNSDFNRLTLRVNNDYHLTDRLLFGHNLAFSYTEGNRPPGILSSIYRADPSIAPGNASGVFNDESVHGSSSGNPAATLFYTRNREEGARLVGNLFTELNFLNNFTVRSSFGLDYGNTEFKDFAPEFLVSPTQQNIDSDLKVHTTRNASWLWENTITYNYVADRHRVTALAGITAQSVYADSIGCERHNLVGEDESLWYCSAGAAVGQTNLNRPSTDYRMLSYLFRTNYAFKDRYLLTASVRVDGSSRFGAEDRYGTFPSFAVGWNVSEEPFLQGKRAIRALKLRASWGKIGNDKIGNYPAVALVTGNLNAVFGPGENLHFGSTLIGLANPLVRWEETSQTNLGADMSLFDDKLQATLDYYRRTTDGILVQVPLPALAGVPDRALPFQNAAEVLNTGVEAALTWRHKWGQLNYELGLNGTTINNEVKSLGTRREPIFAAGQGGLGALTRTVVGQPIGCFWGLKMDGVFQDAAEIAAGPLRGGEVPGDLRYADLNGDGTVRDGDDKTYIGCPIPDVVYGLHARVNWGRLDFSAAFSGQWGNEVYNGKMARQREFGNDNFETSVLNRWTGPGTSNREPRVTNAGHNFVLSDRFMEDGSFLKLQSLQLGYRLPLSVTNLLRVQQARLYLNGTNVFQIADYSGYTPELAASSVIESGIDQFEGVFPPARTFTVGLDLTF